MPPISSPSRDLPPILNWVECFRGGCVKTRSSRSTSRVPRLILRSPLVGRVQASTSPRVLHALELMLRKCFHSAATWGGFQVCRERDIRKTQSRHTPARSFLLAQEGIFSRRECRQTKLREPLDISSYLACMLAHSSHRGSPHVWQKCVASAAFAIHSPHRRARRAPAGVSGCPAVATAVRSRRDHCEIPCLFPSGLSPVSGPLPVPTTTKSRLLPPPSPGNLLAGGSRKR